MTSDTPEVECLVIGAGPGGLGTAALLRRASVGVLVLERAPQVAATWRAAYDRLSLNTSSWFSHLPRGRFPRSYGRWLRRDQFVGHLEHYVQAHALDVRTGVEALRVDRVGDLWEVATTQGPLRAPNVVVATGKQRVPVVPPWPGRDGFSGRLLHAADYRNADPHVGRRALVVGTGNSGMDIALDLATVARTPVWLAARRPPHLMPREVLGLPHDLLGVSARRAPRRLVDANARLIRRLVIGDLSAHGLPLPDDGAVRRFETDGRVPAIETGELSAAVRAGTIEVVPGVERFDVRAVVLTGGLRVEPDVVVAATGYRPGLERLVRHLGVLGPDGMPLGRGGTAAPGTPGLFFVGFVDPRSGALRELRLEARRVARAVS